ncbi:FT-interacting protein 3-like isoform X2 [Zingiber officinale]|uniref:FT-interacting protein 3-like isoform X2 n=1 Tax=Zingiber officinale TaxID=94328 RepID=UPI001C4A7BC4|nr:FT-interacting protein 3-like isoform X2 [Zingiber officinale]
MAVDYIFISCVSYLLIVSFREQFIDQSLLCFQVINRWSNNCQSGERLVWLEFSSTPHQPERKELSSMMSGNLKLGVEVVSAHDLIGKDGQGTVSAYVELEFDGQKFRTTVKEKDVNPVWNEIFYFNISDPSALSDRHLEAFVYHANRGSRFQSCIGKVRIAGTSFVPYTDAVELFYPLEKRALWSRVKGELGLKVFLTNDPSIRASNPKPAVEPLLNIPAGGSQAEAVVAAATESFFQDTRPDSVPVRTFHHLPRDPEQLFYSAGAPAVEESVRHVGSEMKAEPPRVMRMLSSSAQQPVDFQLKETSPYLGGGRIVGGRMIPSEKAGAFDLVEKMEYLFIRVVKARDLPAKDITGSLDPYVEVRLGNYKGTTRHFEKNQNPEWNQVFAFPNERVQASVVEVVLKDKDVVKDDFVGIVRLDLHEIPTRVPPDSPLAPEWYRLEGKKGEKLSKGELMLAVWLGTQADESFAYATHSDSIPAVDPHTLSNFIRAKVYHAPRLWYVRVNIIEAHDVFAFDKSRVPDVLCKVRLGNQMLRTKAILSRTANFLWNEEFMFVAAEPFEEDLVLSVEDRVAHNKDEEIGRVHIPLTTIDKRADNRIIHSRWWNLKKHVALDLDQLKEAKFSSKIHARICLDGGYHVLDESTQYSSDLRPTAKQLWKPPIGLLELGILNVAGLHPMKTRETRGTCDPYCVAKYGHKWVRTRTVVDELNPRFNEQYTWDVYDHATVLTVGVFDNWQLVEKDSGSNGGNKDVKIGKVRIRLSTLQTGRIYTNSYPLLVLHNSGVKKMGEIHLAIRFSVTSMLSTIYIYSKPLLPKMHYVLPLPIIQQELLRHQAVQIVAARLSRMEPPLRREVVEYMSDAHSHLWSMRRSKANFFRLMAVFSGLFAVWKWFDNVCSWKNPVTTILVHILFVMLVCFPELILPTVFVYMFLIGVWNYRFRPRYPPHMNTKISHVEAVHPDELDEEFDTYPTSRSPEIVRMRYDRLRSVAGRIQTVVGDIATQGERLLLLLTWRDPRATAMFLVFCLCAAMVLYVTPFQIIAAVCGFYYMRHPRFRHKLPSAPLNFFRRLPARTDSLL